MARALLNSSALLLKKMALPLLTLSAPKKPPTLTRSLPRSLLPLLT
jgi:hypothetical protein